MTAPHILVVEDDEDIAGAIARGLRREGYAVTVAETAAAATRALDLGCDAAIVDVMLGDERGDDLVRGMRLRGIEIPVIMLSALSSVGERAAGLAAGADDYVAKPFEFAELIARLRVQETRRTRATAQEPVFDPETREIAGRGRKAVLTQREADLLAFFLSREGDVISRGAIFDALWLGEGGTSDNVVDVYIGYLRRKLAPPEAFGIEIRTVRGKGFVLNRPG